TTVPMTALVMTTLVTRTLTHRHQGGAERRSTFQRCCGEPCRIGGHPSPAETFAVNIAVTSPLPSGSEVVNQVVGDALLPGLQHRQEVSGSGRGVNKTIDLLQPVVDSMGEADQESRLEARRSAVSPRHRSTDGCSQGLLCLHQ